uniref:Small ribosomal subunit protein uS5c n=1 Tax=Undaria pinnatifida TaxID=74381 RepID=A0A0R6MC42_UNDPI|nr:30S ribosomal protein S5 [Undaria pinnatifida]YP_011002444.1 30S ribosomal protein S5 [Undaria peterseniana]AKG50011.1 30S ribosomal protein S5 [Undaria pinnatifida]AMM05497.1 ribosomal protein S5 [Undaria pinnatifida]UXC96922.1 30S ribosomal protein S5 [Undaria pinnatifida]UXC97060.1 30S ribosomal protein S5 [Undaria pinnatifida]UXC97198.1 30S ribosomal protein S5 [Undaria pinnatifida]
MNTPNKKIRWEQRVVKISRVSKVVKGGKKISFRATVVVGDMEERVGVGVGKAEEVSTAIKKAETDAKKNVLTIPIAEGKTIPHAMVGIAGGSKVFIRPAVPGTGVIAGGSVRIVLELAGIKNILSKQLGSNNPLNNARATIVALKSLNTIEQVMQKRQISLEQVLGK